VSVLVEIKSHPILLDQDLDIFVVLGKVFPKNRLFLNDNLHHESKNLSGTVVDHVEITLQWGIHSVVEELIELYLAVPDLVVECLDTFLKVSDDVILLSLD